MTANYWDSVADRKSFHHPFDLELFSSFVPSDSRVIDIGCGYGRILALLRDAGYQNTLGIDASAGMIERARREHPDIDFRQASGAATGEPADSADAVILFAVLTSVPEDGQQRLLIAECRRVLRRGGVLYVSDLYLSDDARNVERYQHYKEEFGVYGVFRLDDGGVMRHHARSWINSLFADFQRLHHAEFPVLTMNGNAAQAFQYLGRKPAEKPVKAAHEGSIPHGVEPEGGMTGAKEVSRRMPMRQ